MHLHICSFAFLSLVASRSSKQFAYKKEKNDTDHADDDDDDDDDDQMKSSSHVDMMISAVDGDVVDRVGVYWWGVVDDLSVGRVDGRW